MCLGKQTINYRCVWVNNQLQMCLGKLSNIKPYVEELLVTNEGFKRLNVLLLFLKLILQPQTVRISCHRISSMFFVCLWFSFNIWIRNKLSPAQFVLHLDQNFVNMHTYTRGARGEKVSFGRLWYAIRLQLVWMFINHTFGFLNAVTLHTYNVFLYINYFF